MKFFLRLTLPAILWAVFAPSSLFAATPARVDCGEYSFELPQNFELRNIEITSPDFVKNLELNSPFAQKDLLAATVTCLREKKTSQKNFALPAKEKIEFLTGSRQSSVQLLVSATENTSHDNMRIKFSLLEEHTVNSRVINGRERFMVAVEVDAEDGDWHTVLFISDFSRFDGFFNTDEYKSHITDTAVQVMNSIKKRFP